MTLMTCSVTKSLPSSSWYSGSGSTTINLKVDSIVVNCKKSLIKVQVPQGSSTQAGNPVDYGKNKIKDLKRIEDTVKLKCWIEDETGSTAWNKAWKLRAMCASGGVLDSLYIGNIAYTGSNTKAFLEEVSFITNPQNTINLTESAGKGVARIEADLSFYIGSVF